MTETTEDRLKPPVRLREMNAQSNSRDTSGNTTNKRISGGPLKSPFSSGLSNRDSGIGNDSPASVSTSGHFPFGEDTETDRRSITHALDFENSGNLEDDLEVFEESFENAAMGEPVAASTPVSKPIAIPQRGGVRSRMANSAQRPIQHRYSTGMFGNFPGENVSRTISTQTPSPSSQVIDQAVNWQLGSDEYDFGSLPIEPENQPSARGTAVAYLRECSLHSSCEVLRDNLPDLVQVPTRARALSEPHIQPYRRELERSFGRELQRLGDDFHSSYGDLRAIPIREEMGDNPEVPPSSSFPGAAPTEKSWWVKIKTAIVPSSPRGKSDKSRQDEEEEEKDKKK